MNDEKIYEYLTNNERDPAPYPRLNDTLPLTSYYDQNDVVCKTEQYQPMFLERKKQYFKAYGLYNGDLNAAKSLATQLFFIYFGGLIQARKQFIPGFLYFRNSHYNWVGGLKFMFIGATIGSLFMTFNYGIPHLFEDFFRNKLRAMTTTPPINQGFKK